MERDVTALDFAFNREYFNSHAHVERDVIQINRTILGLISTHTLTWSVTDIAVPFGLIFAISTHTLTWSVTCNTQARKSMRYYFNSHAHVERDVL